MYIIAIAWLYVTLLMAATEASIMAGILTFVFYGLFPSALFIWLMATPERRRRKRASEAAVVISAEHGLGQPDGQDAQRD